MHRILTLGIVSTVLAIGAMVDSTLADDEAEKKAAELTKQADAAQMRENAAQQALKTEQAKLTEAQNQLQLLKIELSKAPEALKQAQADLKPKMEAVEKAAAAKTAAEKATEVPKRQLELSQQAAAAAQSLAAELGKASAAAAKLTEIEKLRHEAAKGTPQEKDTATRLEATTALATALGQQSTQAGEAVKTSAAEVTKWEAALKPLQENVSKTAQAMQAAQNELTKVQQQIAALEKTLAETPEKVKQAETQIAALTDVVVKAEATYAAAAAETLKLRVAEEQILITSGRMVSFSDKIAPIFWKRCLACHNARTAKGRFNMESYAAIMKGGESGAVIEPGDGDLSTLYIMVEDGSMPKEADPLTEEEQALVKKWIDTGAKLNAGIAESAPLMNIMPKLAQPMPPEEYRVAVPITAIAFSRDGQLVATSGYHEVLLWNAADGKLVRRITNIAERVYDAEFSPDGSRLAIAAGTPAEIGEVKLFSVETGALLADLVTTDDSVFGVAFSPDGTRLAACGADRAIRVIGIADATEQLLIEDHADWVMDIAWSPDGSKLASASRDKTSKVFDSQTGDSLVTFNGHSEPVFGAAFAPDGKQVVTSGSDKNLRVWNVSDGKQARAIAGFGNEIFRIQVTADGQVYSSSADKTARLHNLADGKAVRTFSGHTDWVYSIAFHPETKRVATGSYNGEVRIWNAEDGAAVVTFIAAPGLSAAETAANK